MINLQRGNKLTVENRKSREKKTDMLRSIGKQSGGIRGVSPGEEMVGYGGKDLQKRKVFLYSPTIKTLQLYRVVRQ